MARDEPQVNFRIPIELKAKLEVDAKANNRTLTAEIVARLQGPSPIDRLREQVEKTTFRVSYSFACFSIKTFLTVGQMVIDDASEELRQTKSFKLLHQIISTMRIPPELPTSIDDASEELRKTESFKLLHQIISPTRIPPELPIRPVISDVSLEVTQRSIEDLIKAAEFIEVAAKTNDES